MPDLFFYIILFNTLGISNHQVSVEAETRAPIITTEYGSLVGITVDNSYHAYLGVPYAQPPLGTLRFEPPQPLTSNWTAPGVVLNATRHAAKCLQWSTTPTARFLGDEDCLYLNVFVPLNHNDKSTAKKQLLPVLVFIHGGAFMWGSADFYGERWLMQHGGVMLVTFNYRLGPFGFLSTEDASIAGNMGLKDQALALRFVHEQIIHFGGNPAQLLLAGWSAGGASVHYHMVSEYTKPTWFQSGASFSGTALCPCHAIYKGEALRKARKLARFMNCTASSSGAMKTCLQAQPASELAKAIPHFYKFAQHPFTIFGPVAEHATVTQPFLSAPVADLMRAGRTKPKPWLITLTAEDGALGVAELLKRDENGQELIGILEKRWQELVPIMFFFNTTLTTAERERKAEELRHKYFGDAEIGLDTYKQLEHLYNDELSMKHVNQTAELYVNFTPNARAYGYVYDNPPEYGLGNVIAERDDWKFGTLHGDDIFLIFNTDMRQNHPMRSDEKVISEEFIEMLAEFAKNGVPTFAGKPLPQLGADNNFDFLRLTREYALNRTST